MSSRTVPKWKIVENVVTAIERTFLQIPGAKVIANASIPEKESGDRRQVDVYLEIPAGQRILRVGVEVSDKSRRLTKPQVEQLITKLKALDIDQGCIVSRSGFVNDAIAMAERHGIDLKTVREIERPHWWGAPNLTFNLTEVEPLRADFCFTQDVLVEASAMLNGENFGEVIVTLADGREYTMNEAVRTQGPRAIGLPQFASLKDGDVFEVRLVFPDASFSCHRGALPRPAFVHATYRVKYFTENATITAFEHSDGVTALTSMSPLIGKQVTLVAQEETNDTRTFSVTLNDPSPKKSRLSRRRHAPTTKPRK